MSAITKHLDNNQTELLETHPITKKIADEKMQQYGIMLLYGWTGMPPQVGHTSYLEEAVKALQPTEVRVVPNKVSPFKVGNETYGITPDQKLEMTKRSLSDHPDYVIDDQELKREGASYTWMTIDSLCQKMNNENIKAKIYLLVSDETAEEFYAWGRVRYILDNTTLVFGNRPGMHFDMDRLEKRMREINRLAETHLIKTVKRGDKEVKVIEIDGAEHESLTIEGKEVPASKIVKIEECAYDVLRKGHMPFSGKVDISSTQIRKRIEEKQPITGLVHPRLEEYIKSEGLFQLN